MVASKKSAGVGEHNSYFLLLVPKIHFRDAKPLSKSISDEPRRTRPGEVQSCADIAIEMETSRGFLEKVVGV